MKISKKERKVIYEKAIYNIKNDIGARYLCGQLYGAARESSVYLKYYESLPDAFPEFGLFKPTRMEQDEYNLDICWFTYNDIDENHAYEGAEMEGIQMERLICLELCLLLLKDSEE